MAGLLAGAAKRAFDLHRVSQIDSKDPMNSYMFRKISGTGTFTGSQMPPASAPNGPPTADQIKTLENWIRQGSPNN